MKFLEFIASVFLLCLSLIIIPIALVLSAAKSYAKKLNWAVLLGIAAFSILLAIANNLRVDKDKSVEWFGTQDVMEKPADVL